MLILFQTISEQSQKHFQTSCIPCSAKSTVFARKIQLTGSLCQLFPMSQHAYSSPQHFSSLAQHTHSSIPEPRTSSGSLIPCQQPSPLLLPPSISLHTSCSLTAPPSSKAEKRAGSSREGAREKDTAEDQCWALSLHIYKK